MKCFKRFLLIAAALVPLSCGDGGSGDTPEDNKPQGFDEAALDALDAQYVEPDFTGFYNRASFEDQQVTFFSPTLTVTRVGNPRKSGGNTSRRCGHFVSGGGAYEFIYTNQFNRTFDFKRTGPVFWMKVLAPKNGAKITLSIDLGPNSETYLQTVESDPVLTTKAGVWEDLRFDLTSKKPTTNKYAKIILKFDVGEKSSGEDWYFDDIRIPDDDISDLALFKRSGPDPVMAPDRSHQWMNKHIVNAAILSPENSRDGNWWMYARGGNDINGSNEQIGVFTQKASDFNPLGPWTYYGGNPVIPVGKSGSYDEWRCLDGAPVVGPNGITYLYYKARTRSGNNDIGLAWAEDGYHFTKLDQPWMKNAGTCDALYYDGKYYIFRGTHVDLVDNPLNRDGVITRTTITPGGAPDHFDDFTLHGTMVFRLSGVDKWFMAYQGSPDQYDFPYRFHIALSDDLVTWTKVQNPQPLFTRGPRGKWDQCAIWYPEIFEWQDTLYLYYEGWGVEADLADRDAGYTAESHSSVGAATCPKADFLKWCGLAE